MKLKDTNTLCQIAVNMPQHLTVEERSFLVERFHQTRNYEQVLQEFQVRFPGRHVPHKKTISWNVRKFSRTGTVRNIHKERCGRRRTGRSAANINVVRNVLQQNPSVTCRKNPTNIPRATFNRIIKLDIQWHPFRIFMRHELQNADYRRRLQFSAWFINQCRNPRFIYNLVIGDESSFGLNGEVTTNNVRMYAPKGQAPDFYYEKRSDRRKINVWAGLCGNGDVVGPYFFDQNMNGRTYLAMLNNFVLPNLARIYNAVMDSEFTHSIWWAQDGAPPHRAREVRRKIVQIFGNRVIALGHGEAWPARSPDLTPCDFFLWGHIKSKVYTSPPASIAVLRRRIIDAFNELKRNRNMVRSSFNEMLRRAQVCQQNNGGHVEGH